MGYDIASLLSLLDKIAIISFGFLGGVYFAFSSFVMQSLNEIDKLYDIFTGTEVYWPMLAKYCRVGLFCQG